MNKKFATIYIDKLTAELIDDLCNECSPTLFTTLGLEEYDNFYIKECTFDDGTKATLRVFTRAAGMALRSCILVVDENGDDVHASDYLCGVPMSSYTFYDGDTEYIVEFQRTNYYLTKELVFQVSSEVSGIELPDEYIHVLDHDDRKEEFTGVSIPNNNPNEAITNKVISYKEVADLGGVLYSREIITF